MEDAEEIEIYREIDKLIPDNQCASAGLHHGQDDA
jgi:hypothetical protein